MNHIDLSTLVRQTVSCELYSNLVTRPTGVAVRREIERLVAETSDRSLTIIDFSHVSMIDFSCADEVIAKLLLRFSAENAPHEVYFLFRGVTEDHLYAIGDVLRQRGLALVVEQADGVHLEGEIPDDERRAWDTVHRLGRAQPEDVVQMLGEEEAKVQRALDALWRRRLVMNLDGSYVAVGGDRG